MAIDAWPSLLSQTAFVNPVKPQSCTTGSVETVNDFNKNVCDAKLLPTTTLWIVPVSVT